MNLEKTVVGHTLFKEFVHATIQTDGGAAVFNAAVLQ